MFVVVKGLVPMRFSLPPTWARAAPLTFLHQPQPPRIEERPTALGSLFARQQASRVVVQMPPEPITLQPFRGERAANLVCVADHGGGKTTALAAWALRLTTIGVRVVILDGAGAPGRRSPYRRLAETLAARGAAVEVQRLAVTPTIPRDETVVTLYDGHPFGADTDQASPLMAWYSARIAALTAWRTAQPLCWDQAPVVVIVDGIRGHQHDLPSQLCNAARDWPLHNMHLWWSGDSLTAVLNSRLEPLWTHATIACVGVLPHEDRSKFADLNLTDILPPAQNGTFLLLNGTTIASGDVILDLTERDILL
jgi:hypothetical protein